MIRLLQIEASAVKTNVTQGMQRNTCLSGEPCCSAMARIGPIVFTLAPTVVARTRAVSLTLLPVRSRCSTFNAGAVAVLSGCGGRHMRRKF